MSRLGRFLHLERARAPRAEGAERARPSEGRFDAVGAPGPPAAGRGATADAHLERFRAPVAPPPQAVERTPTRCAACGAETGRFSRACPQCGADLASEAQRAADAAHAVAVARAQEEAARAHQAWVEAQAEGERGLAHERSAAARAEAEAAFERARGGLEAEARGLGGRVRTRLVLAAALVLSVGWGVLCLRAGPGGPGVRGLVAGWALLWAAALIVRRRR